MLPRKNSMISVSFYHITIVFNSTMHILVFISLFLANMPGNNSLRVKFSHHFSSIFFNVLQMSSKILNLSLVSASSRFQSQGYTIPMSIARSSIKSSGKVAKILMSLFSNPVFLLGFALETCDFNTSSCMMSMLDQFMCHSKPQNCTCSPFEATLSLC